MTMPRLARLPSIAIAAGVLLSLAGAPALAQSPDTNQGTEEERRACTPDVMRLCREFIPSVSRITQCLIDRRAELNPECKLVMTPKPQPVQHAGTSKRQAAQKRPAAKRAAQPAPTVRAAAAEPGEVIRPPLNIVPPAAAAKPAKKKARPAKSAAAAGATGTPAPKPPAPKPQ